MKLWPIQFLVLLFCFMVGCDTHSGLGSRSPSDLTVGSWVYGEDPDYDWIQATILEADAIINITDDHVIQWYDSKNQSWKPVSPVDMLQGQLEAVSGRSFITIGVERRVTPKGKESEFIKQIKGFATALGYDTAVVIFDHGDTEEIILEITDVFNLARQ